MDGVGDGRDVASSEARKVEGRLGEGGKVGRVGGTHAKHFLLAFRVEPSGQRKVLTPDQLGQIYVGVELLNRRKRNACVVPYNIH
eukprot:1180971-Prorocentrum_minimum.AAC.3